MGEGETLFHVSQVDESDVNADEESSNWGGKSVDDTVPDVQTFVSSHMLFSHLLEFGQGKTMDQLNNDGDETHLLIPEFGQNECDSTIKL